MKFSGKIEHGTSTEPLNFGGDPWLSDCTIRTKICALRVLLVYLYIFLNFFYEWEHRIGTLCPVLILCPLRKRRGSPRQVLKKEKKC